MSRIGGRRRKVVFLENCLCSEPDITLISTEKKSSAHSDDELRQKAMKRVIDICENSINRDDVHMTIQCDKCAKCRTCRDIRKINASSYNDFVEQQAMGQLVEFVEGKDGEPGFFTSPLPLKPFNINSVKNNRATADEQNKRMIEKLQNDPVALKQVKEEMENLQRAGFIARHARRDTKTPE